MSREKRSTEEMREIKISLDYLKYPEGSCLIELGDTKVLCTASVEERVPPFLQGKGEGWISAEYDMLPRSCETRRAREVLRGRSGRSLEIQRLIGRALRSGVELKELGERTIWIDCDVLQADGGTRIASINGGWIALVRALQFLYQKNVIEDLPIKEFIGAISVGIVNNQMLLDLSYQEDVYAEVDMNVVMTESGRFVEIQGTAEREVFDRDQLDGLLNLAQQGIKKIIAKQKQVLGFV